jgi:hypothetical protein
MWGTLPGLCAGAEIAAERMARVSPKRERSRTDDPPVIRSLFGEPVELSLRQSSPLASPHVRTAFGPAPMPLLVASRRKVWHGVP